MKEKTRKIVYYAIIVGLGFTTSMIFISVFNNNWIGAFQFAISSIILGWYFRIADKKMEALNPEVVVYE